MTGSGTWADVDPIERKTLPGNPDDDTAALTGVIGTDDSDGTVTAIVAVTGVKDEVDDVIVPGAVTKALTRIRPKGVDGHDWKILVSKPEHAEELQPGDRRLPKYTASGEPWPKEAGGLLVKARYNLNTEAGRTAYENAKFLGPDQSFSIGYKVRPGGYKMRGGTRYITDLDIFEYSQVLHGAHRLAQLVAVKSLSETVTPDWYAEPRSGRGEDTEVGQVPGPYAGTEVKLRVVRDPDYWGLPYGTPIRANMRPRGRVALDMRRRGERVSQLAGTTLEADPDAAEREPADPRQGKPADPRQARPAPGTRPSARRREQIGQESEAEGLFPEREAGPARRLRASRKATGEQIVIENAAADVASSLGETGRQLVDVDAEMGRLLDEGVDADEFAELLADNRAAVIAKHSHQGKRAEQRADEDIEDAVEDYRQRVDRRIQEQAEEADKPTRTGRERPVLKRPEHGGVDLDLIHSEEGEQQLRDAAHTGDKESLRSLLPLIGADDPDPLVREILRDKSKHKARAHALVGDLIDEARREFPDTRERAADDEGEEPAGEPAAEQPEQRPEQQGASPEDTAETGIDPETIRLAREDADDALSEGDRDGLADAIERMGVPESDDPRELAAGLLAIPSEIATRRLDSLQRMNVRGEGAQGGGPEPRRPDPEPEPEPAPEPEARPEPRQDAAPSTEPFTVQATDYARAKKRVDAGQGSDRDKLIVEHWQARGPGRFDALTITPGQPPPQPRQRREPEPAPESEGQSPGDRRWAEVLQRFATKAEEKEERPQARAALAALAAVASGTDPAQAAADAAATHPDGAETATALTGMFNRLRRRMADPSPELLRRFEALRVALREATPEPEPERGLEPAPEVPGPPEGTEPLDGDDLARAEALRGDVLGLVEAEDGELEVTEEVAARQDRVEALLEAGSVDTGIADEQLGAVRTDLVGELALQEELRRRDVVRRREQREARAEQARRRAEQAGAAEVADEEAEPEPVPEPAPRRRPGVAGAAEDLADALDSGDNAEINAARERLVTSLRRSRSDSPQVEALRDMVDGDEPLDADTLRQSATALREEARQRRNAAARSRRLARRLERERIRSMIGQVDTELRTRGRDPERYGGRVPPPFDAADTAAPRGPPTEPTPEPAPSAEPDTAAQEGPNLTGVPRDELSAELEQLRKRDDRETRARRQAINSEILRREEPQAATEPPAEPAATQEEGSRPHPDATPVKLSDAQRVVATYRFEDVMSGDQAYDDGFGAYLSDDGSTLLVHDPAAALDTLDNALEILDDNLNPPDRMLRPSGEVRRRYRTEQRTTQQLRDKVARLQPEQRQAPPVAESTAEPELAEPSPQRRAMLTGLAERYAAQYGGPQSPTPGAGNAARYIIEGHAPDASQEEWDWLADHIRANPELLNRPVLTEAERRAEQQRAQEDARAAATDAKAAFDRGDYDTALQLIDRAIELEPANHRWRGARTQIIARRDEPAEPAAPEAPSVEELRGMPVREFHQAMAAMDPDARRDRLAQLGRDEVESLLEHAMLSGDTAYRDQVIDRYAEIDPALARRARRAARLRDADDPNAERNAARARADLVRRLTRAGVPNPREQAQRIRDGQVTEADVLDEHTGARDTTPQARQETGEPDGQAGDTGAAPLPDASAEGVRADQEPEPVLPRPGEPRADTDRGTGRPSRGAERRPVGDVSREGREDEDGADAGRGAGDARDRAARPAEPEPAPRPGDTAETPDAPDRGRPAARRGDDRVREPAGTTPQRDVDRPDDAAESVEGVTEADQPQPDPGAVAAAPEEGQRFRPESYEDFAPAGKKAKLRANMDALRTLRALQTEGRAATPDEQATLARWAGWGGLPEVFDEQRDDYARERTQLRALLSQREWDEARRNTLNAHYTDARVVEALWGAVRDLGFDGGLVLEPGSGSGTFIGFAPDDARMTGVELDSTTAAISSYLYPGAGIRNESFADTRLPDDIFDLTIGNVPFGRFALTDRRHNPDGDSIHNHFIRKSLALTRPGGLVAVLSSRFTLDSQNPAARRRIAEQADLVGAVRLPTGSHERASGTSVIEDVLIFRKREPGAEPQDDQSWLTTSERDIDGQQIQVNDYFTQHPEHVLGEIRAEKGRFGTGDMIVRGDRDMSGLNEVLADIVANAERAGLTATPGDTGSVAPEMVAADADRPEGSTWVGDDGNFWQNVGGVARPFEVSRARAEEVRALIGLRDTLRDLLRAEASSDPGMETLRADLNDRYDRYVARFGAVNRFTVAKNGARIYPPHGFRRDPMSAIVYALETYDPVSGGATKADIFRRRSVAPRRARSTADNPADALALSLDAYGEVRLSEIARMLGTDEDDARAQLGDLVYEQPPLDPEEEQAAVNADLEERGLAGPLGTVEVDLSTVGDTVREPGKLEPAAAYLSGNVRRKLAVARAAADADPRFQPNVDALRAALPRDLGPEEIDGRLGAAWIDADTVKEFLQELLNDRYNMVEVSTSGGGVWSIDGPRHGTLARETWGTEDRPAPTLVQSLLEQRPIKVSHKDPDSGKQIPDLEATLAAQQKAAEISERFTEWLWENPERSRRMQARYNEQFNAIVLRNYDDTERTFPGMAAEFKPRPHQVAAVERIVNEPTALLGHVVGAGKTAEMTLGTGELKRLGLANKPAIVIPNHMLEQFSREYLEVYPQARILAAGTQDLTGDKRREFVARAATGEWDAVILTQGAFEKIPLSVDAQRAYIDRELSDMREQLETARNAAAGERKNSAADKTVKKMEKQLLSAEEALKKKLDKEKDTGGVSFEETGIDYLMVDEAHGYSNLRTLSNIPGAGNTGSDRATDLHMKLEWLRDTSQSGRVATFATGTPIRNTVTQAYIMQRFLRPDLLREAGIHGFDQWAATFGEVVEEMELKPEGRGFRQTARFAKFRNVPELLRLFHTFADIKLADDLKLPTPELRGGGPQIVTVAPSEELRDYVRQLGNRADDVRGGVVEKEVDNMLKISTDGRKAALSMRLVTDEQGQPYEHQPGKLEAAADRIADIWRDNRERTYPADPNDPDAGDHPTPGAMQIVFLDMGTPKVKGEQRDPTVDDGDANWNGYEELRRQLADRGVDPKSVRFVHEAKNDQQKAEMFAAAREGQISVLVGSSEKMGVGTNVQRRAIALHHIDAPWRPADVEQREGRLMRQGNLNAEQHGGQGVQILRYVTEGSFDAYMWQTLERKAKFIGQVMKGSLDVREIEDVGDTAMSYAEVKALATGDPDLLEKAKVDTLLGKLERLARTHARTQTNLRHDAGAYAAAAAQAEADAEKLDAAIEQRRDTRGDAFSVDIDGRGFTKRSEAADAFRDELDDVWHSQRYAFRREPRQVARIGGHTVTAQVERLLSGRDGLVLRFEGVPGEVATLGPDDIRTGALTRVENSLAAMDSQHAQLLRRAAHLREEIDTMRSRIGVGFSRSAELEAARRESARLLEKMQRNARRNEGEDIPYDPLVDNGPVDDLGAEVGAPEEKRHPGMARIAEEDMLRFRRLSLAGFAS